MILWIGKDQFGGFFTSHSGLFLWGCKQIASGLQTGLGDWLLIVSLQAFHLPAPYHMVILSIRVTWISYMVVYSFKGINQVSKPS